MAAGLKADFSRHFRGGPHIRGVLDFPAQPPGITVLFGPSGSGKTTLLRCIAGVERPDSGTITFGGHTWFDGERRAWVPPERRGVGLMHQDYALFPHLSVEENVAYGVRKLGRPGAARRAGEVMEMLGIAGLSRRGVGALSGGEAQRVALARALAPHPSMLLLDEPLSALDGPSRAKIRAELRTLLKGLGIPVAVVTHDRVEALALGDAACVVLDGSVRQSGPVSEVFSRPRDGGVAAAVGFENVIPVHETGGDRAGPRLTVAGQQVAIDGIHAPVPMADAVLCVRARDVILSPCPSHSSESPAMRGTVTAIHPEDGASRVLVDAGVPVWALADGLPPGIAVGAAIAIAFKPGAVRVVPASSL